MIVREFTRCLVSDLSPQGSHKKEIAIGTTGLVSARNILFLISYVFLVFIIADYLTGTSQMSILQNLPLSLCEPGPEHVDGVGNFCLDILAPAPSQLPLSTLYFLDSHGQIPSKTREPDYDSIKQSQIDWFTNITQAQRVMRENDDNGNRVYLSLAFQHIPLPEFGDRHLKIRNGHRREPSESPSFNSQFYDAVAKAGVSAFSCGHDHVNDFCALLSRQPQQEINKSTQPGPWLCYGGGSGFGGYCSYGGTRFHRRMRIWELETLTGTLKTWKRVEYATDRVDELLLVENGTAVSFAKQGGEGGAVWLDEIDP